MGRSKGRRNHVVRHSPLNAINAPMRDSASRKAVAKSVITKLSSVHEKERIESAAAVGAMMAEDVETRKYLVNANILPVLLERLTDSSLEVRVEVTGTLRNLLFDEEEGQSFCDALYKLDIITLLQSSMQALIANFFAAVGKSTGIETAKYDFIYTENITAILLALCESSDEILQGMIMGAPTLVPFLLKALHLSDSPTGTKIMAAQCLMSYTDENINGLKALLAEPVTIESLRRLASAREPALAVAIVGTLQNLLSSGHIEDQMATDLQRNVTQTIGQSLGVIPLHDLVAKEPDAQNEYLTILETGLEILAKAVTVSPDVSETDDVQMTDTGSSDLSSARTVVFTAMTEEYLELVTSLASPIEVPDDQVYPNKLHTTHLLALDCLHNFAWSLVDLPETNRVKKNWLEKAPKLWLWGMQNLPRLLTIDEDISDSSLSLLFALAKTLPTTIRITYEDASSFIKLYHSSLNADLQTKIVGLLGCLASTSGQIETNRTIGTFLITVVASLPRTDADAAIEALDAIFDIYGDAAFDYDGPVFLQNNFLGHLQASLPKVLAMKRAINKRTHRELWSRADDAAQNLAGFIEYKKNERT